MGDALFYDGVFSLDSMETRRLGGTTKTVILLSDSAGVERRLDTVIFWLTQAWSGIS